MQDLKVEVYSTQAPNILGKLYFIIPKSWTLFVNDN